MLESQIQVSVIKALRKRGAYVVRVQSASKNGVPDLLVCHLGRFFALEMKAGAGEATELQIYNGDLIRKAGGKWAVIRSVKEALAFLNNALE